MKRIFYTLLLGSFMGLVAPVLILAQDTVSMQNGSAQGCNFIFYDSGGANEQYADNEQLLYTFTGSAGQYLHLQFSFFHLLTGDTLIIYDGDNTAGRLIGKFGSAHVGTTDYANGMWGQAPPPDLYAASGSFTFCFKSNSSGQGAGWVASIICVSALNMLTPDILARLGLHIINPDSNNQQSNMLTVDIGTQVMLNLADFIVPSIATNDYVVQAIPYNPPYDLWVGTPLGMNTDDKWGSPTNLPFTFDFFGKHYTQACPGANGAVSLNYHEEGTMFPYQYSNTYNIADNGPTPANSIFGVLEDIHPGQYYAAQGDLPAGNITCGVIGEYPNRAFVFNFWRVKLYGVASGVLDNYNSYQIVLFEGTGAIEVHVRHRKCCAITNHNGEGIIGILNSTGTQFLTAPNRGITLYPGWEVLGENSDSLREAWRFWPVAPVASSEIAWFENDTNSQPLFISKSVNITAETNMELIARLQFTAPSGDFYTLLDTLSISVTDTVSAIANSGMKTLKIYPNPTNDLLYIEFGDYFLREKDLTVQITHLSGKMLYRAAVKKAKMQIDMKSYPSGIYIVNLQNRNRQIIQSCRVVKQ